MIPKIVTPEHAAALGNSAILRLMVDEAREMIALVDIEASTASDVLDQVDDKMLSLVRLHAAYFVKRHHGNAVYQPSVRESTNEDIEALNDWADGKATAA